MVKKILEPICCPIIQWIVIRPFGKLLRKQLGLGHFPEKPYLFGNLKKIKSMFTVSQNYNVIYSWMSILSSLAFHFFSSKVPIGLCISSWRALVFWALHTQSCKARGDLNRIRDSTFSQKFERIYIICSNSLILSIFIWIKF